MYIEDYLSKFGTFVKINGLLEISKNRVNRAEMKIIPIQIEKKCLFIKANPTEESCMS